MEENKWFAEGENRINVKRLKIYCIEIRDQMANGELSVNITSSISVIVSKRVLLTS